ncbi:MAG: GGDEF domain-containing protein [Chloroflexota bacterium]
MDPAVVINVLIVAIVANIALLVLAIVVPWTRRRRPEPYLAGAGGLGRSPGTAFVPGSGSSGSAAGAAFAAASDGVGVATMNAGRPSAAGVPGTAPRAISATSGEDALDDDPPTDTLTRLLTGPTWHRIVLDEDARIRRYRRPATIVVLELDGLDRLITRLGQEAGDRVIPAVADTIRREARGADHVARLSYGRFAVLLPETDEIQAINYIERVRRSCDLWLESGAVALRLAIGWSSSSGDGGLAEAQKTATDRMFAEIHRNARRSPEADPDVEPAHTTDDGPEATAQPDEAPTAD